MKPMKTLEVTDDATFASATEFVVARGAGADSEAEVREKTEAVRTIVDDVRERGDAAVAEYTERFDKVVLSPDEFELEAADLDAAVEQVDDALLAALKRAHANIQRFHEKNLRQSWEDVSDDGTVLGQRVGPIESAGLYVPGGKAFYPSSVLMNFVPACVAGVPEIVMVSPPSYEGSIHPVMLAAARIAGATRVFRVGGAQAVAALAYGTESIPAVAKIAGPGNIFVTLAKRLVSAVCDIDKEAGPSEVVVIADEAAEPRYVALELLAQAEHEEEACATLITPSADLAGRVQEEVERQASSLSRTGIIEEALRSRGLVLVVRDLADAVSLTNAIAPEHLSIQTQEPRAVFEGIQNAGAAMLGPSTPVAVGDYYAGPNHVLPTGRRARYASPLTAEDFRKVTSVISYSPQRLAQDADDILLLAEAEELTAHARAVEIRLQ